MKVKHFSRSLYIRKIKKPINEGRVAQRKCAGPIKLLNGGFPGGTVVENLPANAGDMGSSPGLGRSHMPWSD